MTTFKYFSSFTFDLCSDFTLWTTEGGRCIPKELNDGENLRTFPPICDRNKFDCLDSFFKDYCPNKDKSCKDYTQEEHFFCNKSKTCIPNGK